MTALDTMRAISALADGLNDDTIVAMYRGRYNDTIGVPGIQGKYLPLVYTEGKYEEVGAEKIVIGRITGILHDVADVCAEVMDMFDGDESEEAEQATGQAGAMKKWASQCRNDGKMSSMINKLSKVLSVPAANLDANDTIISLPNGALLIDQKAKTVRYDDRFHPEALNTMRCDVPYQEGWLQWCGGPGMDCPEWESYVMDSLSYDITGNKRTDTENIESEYRLLRGIAGYMMLRGNPEQAIVILIGTPGSGRSTIAEVICGVLGGYAVRSRKELIIMQQGSSRIRSDMGTSVVKHLAYVDELNAGDIYDTGTLRYMTNPRITIEVKHKNPYERLNNTKLLIVTNYENKYDSPDDTIIRRLVVLHFFRPRPAVQHTYYSNDLLRREGAGILNWMITGLRDVLESGGLRQLIPPHIAKQIKADVSMQDALSSFFETRIIRTNNPEDVETLERVFIEMKAYFESIKEDPPVKRSNKFSTLMRAHRFDVYTGHGKAKVRGIKLIKSEEGDAVNYSYTAEQLAEESKKRLVLAIADAVKRAGVSGMPLDMLVSAMKGIGFMPGEVSTELMNLTCEKKISMIDGQVKWMG